MHHPTDRITHTTAFVTPVVEHRLEQEIAQWVHPKKDRSDDPPHHERTLYLWATSRSPGPGMRESFPCQFIPLIVVTFGFAPHFPTTHIKTKPTFLNVSDKLKCRFQISQLVSHLTLRKIRNTVLNLFWFITKVLPSCSLLVFDRIFYRDWCFYLSTGVHLRNKQHVHCRSL